MRTPLARRSLISSSISVLESPTRRTSASAAPRPRPARRRSRRARRQRRLELLVAHLAALERVDGRLGRPVAVGAAVPTAAWRRHVTVPVDPLGFQPGRDGIDDRAGDHAAPVEDDGTQRGSRGQRGGRGIGSATFPIVGELPSLAATRRTGSEQSRLAARPREVLAECTPCSEQRWSPARAAASERRRAERLAGEGYHVVLRPDGLTGSTRWRHGSPPRAAAAQVNQLDVTDRAAGRRAGRGTCRVRRARRQRGRRSRRRADRRRRRPATG